jgi:RNA polymerase II subunit A small phosphatase-like protein
VEIDGQIMPVFVQKRPFCEEFIKHMAPHYEIVMFTASLEKYANPLYAKIDTQNKTDYSLYRESCTYWNGIFVKDMTRLGRNMKDVIIVDNSPAAYLFQPENALPC